jgi:hypothetical protein
MTCGFLAGHRNMLYFLQTSFSFHKIFMSHNILFMNQNVNQLYECTVDSGIYFYVKNILVYLAMMAWYKLAFKYPPFK